MRRLRQRRRPLRKRSAILRRRSRARPRRRWRNATDVCRQGADGSGQELDDAETEDGEEPWPTPSRMQGRLPSEARTGSGLRPERLRTRSRNLSPARKRRWMRPRTARMAEDEALLAEAANRRAQAADDVRRSKAMHSERRRRGHRDNAQDHKAGLPTARRRWLRGRKTEKPTTWPTAKTDARTAATAARTAANVGTGRGGQDRRASG